MSATRVNLTGNVLVFGILSFGLWGCSPVTEVGTTTPEGGAGGTVSTGKGGTTNVGGTLSAGGTIGAGGSEVTGGTKAAGGAPATGGTTVTGSGGSATGGATGVGGSTGGAPAAGGMTARGGTTGNGGASTVATGGGISQGGNGVGGSETGGAGKGGSGIGSGPGAGGKSGTGGGQVTGGTVGVGGNTLAAGGTTTTGCQKGQVKANEVVIMGESFYAMSPQYIQKRIEEKAKAAGAIGASDSYRNVAVSGQTMNYVATTEWNNAVKSATKVVIMDGGGIDCMSSDCPSCPTDFQTLLDKMAAAGVKEVIYTRYPEPGAPPGSNTTLKGHLDNLMPKMQPVCEGATGLKCHWVDLRPVWVTGDTTDGLHPTQSGGNHVGDAIWAEMVKDCIAQ